MADERIAVTIAVPTFRRADDLRELLPQLRDQAHQVSEEPGGPFTVDILVVDNDPARSGEPAVAEQPPGSVRYVVEPHPGIAAVRNRALDESAGSRLLAFIDDDERPHDGWLAYLLATWLGPRPAAVSGRVVAAFESELDPWIAAGRFFTRRSLPTGTVLDVAAAGNVLLDLDQVRASGVRFALDLGLSGGEDTLFSRQLARAGFRMLWCDESVITDMVPRSRMTRRWVLRRAWSHGNSAAVVEVRLARSPLSRVIARIRSTVRGVLRIVGGVLRTAWGGLARSARHQARGLRAVCRGAGMIWGAWGGVYQEYSRGEAVGAELLADG
jgi:glycosyltransferase involved in cell wall biosynthesis